jgi:hypothetical protein
MFPVQAAGSLHLFILHLIPPTVFGEFMQMTNSSLQNFFAPYFICLGSKNSLQHFPNAFKLLITEIKSDRVHFCWDFPTDFLLATDWTFRGSNPGAGRSFSLLHSHPQQPWGPPGHLYNEYWGYFPGVKGLGRGVDQPHLSSSEVETVYPTPLLPLLWGDLYFTQLPLGCMQ